MGNADIQSLNKKETLDKAGIVCSVVCAAHCSLPLIISLISPNLAAYFENEIIHFLLLIIVIPLAFISFFKGKKNHKSKTPLLFGALGSVILIIGVLAEHLFDLGIDRVGFYLTLTGSATLIAGHLLNLTLIKKTIL